MKFPEGRYSFPWVSTTREAISAPPVGALRWKPPAPPPGWSGIRDASAFGNKCPQFGATGPIGNEDCLFLNVFKSAQGEGDDDEPVMVFLHGGGNQGGSSSGRRFDDPALATHGVIVVTAQYRLGALGFFTHPLLTIEGGGSSGNYGLMDQIAALTWVRDNIKAFGGDPERVMVFGVSSGGGDVQFLLTSPEARGLFSRAGMESAARVSGLTPKLADAEAADAPLVALLACDQVADVLGCLRAVPADTIVNAQTTAENNLGLPLNPVLEPRISPEDPFEALQRRGTPVPLLIGSTREESTGLFDDATMPLDANGYVAAIHAGYDYYGADVADHILSLYPVESYDAPIYALIAVDSDFAVTCRTREVARAALGRRPVWRYLFTHRVENDPYLNAQRAFHTEETYYVFGHPDQLDTPSAGEIQLSNRMLDYWTRFATAGDPNGPGNPHWPRYGEDDQILQIDESSVPINGYHNPQCDYLSPYLRVP